MKLKATFDKVQKDRKELATSYKVAESSIVWIGDNHYIIMKDGKEIRI